MIEFTKGNLLESSAEALVNTVNEVGVMGKGIALMFRDAFPENTRAYEEAVAEKRIRVGEVFVTQTNSLLGPKWIVNFPTKKHWRQPSKLEWIRTGLRDLIRSVRELGIHSIAVPPLGCGNGGLEWAHVKREIEAVAAELPSVHFLVYEPTAAYVNAPKRSGVESLTPARALIAELVRRYSVLGLDCSILEVQKLAWFLERVLRIQGAADPLHLDFGANKFGPYADKLRHLLDQLDGSYLHSEKRIADSKPFDLIWFEDSRREDVAAYLNRPELAAYKPALEATSSIIDGFESPFGMELLATVDWLLSREKASPTVDGIRESLTRWPSGRAAAQRKAALFTDEDIGLALEQLSPMRV